MSWKCNACKAANAHKDKKCWKCELLRNGDEDVIVDKRIDLRGKEIGEILEEMCSYIGEKKEN